MYLQKYYQLGLQIFRLYGRRKNEFNIRMKSLDSGWLSEDSKLMLKSPIMKMFLFSLVNWDRVDSRCSLNLTGLDEGCL